MASIDRIMALSEEIKKRDKQKNKKPINTSSINIADLSNEIRSGNRNSLNNYYDPIIAPIGGFAKQEPEKKWYQKILQTPDAFNDNDGFWDNVGDTVKSVGGTVADIGLGAVKGVASIGEGLGELGSAGIAQVADWIGQDDYANKVRQNIANKEGRIITKALDDAQNSIDTHSVIGDTGDAVSEGAGYLAGIWATGGVLGNAGRVGTMFGTSAGSTFSESYSKEGVEDWQAWSKAIGSGVLSATVEQLGGVFGKGNVDTKIANAISSRIMNGAGKIATRMGVAGGSELAEEFIEYAGNHLLDYAIDGTNALTSKNEATFHKDWDWDEVGQNMFTGFILGSGAKGLQLSGDVVNDMQTTNGSLTESINRVGIQEDIKGQTEVLLEEKASLEDELKSKDLTQTDIDEIFTEMQEVDNKIKALNKETAPLEAPLEVQETENTEPIAQQITEEVKEPTLQEQAHKEAEAIMEQLNQERALKEQEKNATKRAEIQNRISELETKLAPLQAQIEAENTTKHKDKISSLENLKTQYTDPLVQEAIDNQITKLKQETEEQLNPAPASQEVVENARTQNLQNITDEDIAPTEMQLTTENQQELQVYEDFVNENGIDALDSDSKARYDYLKRAEKNGNIAPTTQDVAITEDTTDITTRIQETLGLKKKDTTELYNKVAKANSVEETRRILEDYKDINEKVQDDEVKAIRDYIRTTKKDVSSFKNNITDYGVDFYKKYGRKLNIGNSGIPMDTFYQELSSQYPQYFDSNVTNVADQLETIANFMDNNQATYTQKVGEIPDENLNKLAEEYYTEVHAKEFNKFSKEQGAYDDIESIIDPEQLKQDIQDTVKEQVQGIKTELKSLQKQLKEIQAPIKETVQNAKELLENVQNNQETMQIEDAPIQTELDNSSFSFEENIAPDVPELNTEQESIETEQFMPSTEKVAQNKNTEQISTTNTDTELKDIKKTLVSNPNMSEEQLIELMDRVEALEKKRNRIQDPLQISKLTEENADTTPDVPIRKMKKGDKESKFYKNVTETTEMLSEETRQELAKDDNIKFYKGVTNKQSLTEAYKRLEKGGEAETLRWLKDDFKDATDVAEGWVLLKQYQDKGDTRGAVEIAKKMRNGASTGGQIIQAYNIMQRLTPEGMFMYAQKELSEAFEIMSKHKTKKWIDANKSKFELTPQDTALIKNNMEAIQTMPDGYEKRVKLAEIQKVIQDKIPPEKGQGIKAWMRISMLGNPKTLITRNPLGNLAVTPVNAVADMIASRVDKIISEKTKVRTTGNLDLKQYAKGFKKGTFESYSDFKRGINTRNMDGNRFEVNEGKNFNDNKKVGKALNKVDNAVSFALDIGDRGFYEATFTNSINNQMVLNNTTKVTQEMIDIATTEALSRTWQDNNAYTEFVLKTREMLNKVGVKGYGLGDVLIPFAKTPANLTKAIIDYSPAGFVNSLIEGKKLKNAIETDQFDAKMQHKFVQDLGKATAGTMLYVLGYALAQAGITTGESEEDKDAKNFLKNTMGVNPYSIKIGDHTFTYDWAQPISAPLSIMANISKKKEEEATLGQAILSSLDTAGNLLLQQSFMESINTVISNNDGIATGLQEAVFELPSRAVPTLFKQITDMVDGTQRQTFVYDDPLQTAKNKIINKIPFLSDELAPSVDTLGREIQKYGGENNAFNVFLNPANLNATNISESGEEIYRLYQETGDKTIMPRQVPYYINSDGKKIKLNNEERARFQTMAGTMADTNIQALLNNETYENLSDKEKTSIVSDIVNYSYNLAQSEVAGTELSDKFKSVKEYTDLGGYVTDYYLFENGIDDTTAEAKKESVTNSLLNMSATNQQKAYLYGKYYSSDKTLNKITSSGISFDDYLTYSKDSALLESSEDKINYLYNAELSNEAKEVIYETSVLTGFDDEDKYKDYKVSKKVGIDINSWLSFKKQDFVSDKNSEGKTINGSRKQKVYDYINSMDIGYEQRLILAKMEYPSEDRYNNEIIEYLNNDNSIDYETMVSILEDLDFKVTDDGNIYWD